MRLKDWVEGLGVRFDVGPEGFSGFPTDTCPKHP